MDIPKRILRFGNLDDILYLRKMEIMLLNEKINAFLNELYNSLICELSDDEYGCKNCSIKEDCEKWEKGFSAEISVIEEKIKRIKEGVVGLWDEKDFIRERFLKESKNRDV